MGKFTIESSISHGVYIEKKYSKMDAAKLEALHQHRNNGMQRSQFLPSN